MPTTIKFNLNNKIRAKLSPTGQRIWYAYWEAHAELPGIPSSEVDRLHALGKECEIEEQLWVVMQIFGPHCYGHMLSFAENSTIEFEIQEEI